MTEAKRARALAVPWLLPPIILQVVHCLDAAFDVLAFLKAVPDDARDEALDALVLLLDERVILWPVVSLNALASVDPSTVTKVLPTLHVVSVSTFPPINDVCRGTPLSATAIVHAAINGPHQISALFGPWVPAIVDLAISIYDTTPLDANVLQQQLAACTQLKTLRIMWNSDVNQGQWDLVWAAIGVACPRLVGLRLHLQNRRRTLESCDSLLAWLAQPNSARVFKLINIDFRARAAKPLAHALLTSTTLHTIKLLGSTNVRNAFLHPSSPALPPQLRSLSVGLGLISGSAASLASKLAFSAITRFGLCCRDVREMSLGDLPPTLRTLKLDRVVLTDFPLPPQLGYLQLRNVTMTSDAVADLIEWLATSTTLLWLDLTKSGLLADQLRMIFYALPRCLSRQENTCTVRLEVTYENEPLIAAVVIQIRNTQQVQLELCSGDNDPAMRQRLVTALGTSSRVALRFHSKYGNQVRHEELVKCATFHGMHHSHGWLFSPTCTPWMPLA